ncbi:MAG: tRNA uridine-5-carboxymethylaminomethyl(34) synthesis GTPase MnmE [Candidatus Omnitrophota bacterium]|jgi:tRNA modification GTPase
MSGDKLEETIAAISTPVGEGGIGIVRLSGDIALKIADGIFVSKDKTKPSKFKTYSVHYGHVVNKGREVIDEVILTVMKAPGSYTKEDIVEINCHGGIQAVKKVLDLVVRRGARIAEPGEFTKRAFLNGRIDLAQAEGVLDCIRAKTEGSLKVAMHQLEGDLSRSIDSVRDAMLDIAAHIEASIDFPDEGLELEEKKALIVKCEDVISKLRSLIDSYTEGQVFREGVLAIICGKPNTGKSSLMNLLLKRDRVIVSPVPGTTRDAVEEMINLKGIPIRLVDTAGISKTKDTVEREGVKRSKKYLEMADIVMLILDSSVKLEKRDLDIIELVKGKNKIVVLNKIDLPCKIDRAQLKELFKEERVVEISVEKRSNINKLEDAVSSTIFKGGFNQGESAIISSARHKRALDKSYKCMLSVRKALRDELWPETTSIDLKEAIFNIGLVTGKSVSEDILDRIFERFCIGK